jgi:hypothetical protein
MTQFKYRYLDLILEGTKKIISVVPEEYVINRAFMIWLESGKPEGKDFENYLKAKEEYSKDYIIVPTETYLGLEKTKYQYSNKGYSTDAAGEIFC